MTSVRVVCRFRPTNEKETAHDGGETNMSIVEPDAVQVKGHKFTFDRVFPGTCSQLDVYEDTGKPSVSNVISGYNTTIFAYGQTSSGKTYTMQGPDICSESLKGLTTRMIEEIFEHVSKSDESTEWTLKCSYIEIYLEHIRDLLDARKVNLKVRETRNRGLYVEGATELYVGSVEEVLNVIKIGTHNRAVAETNMNTESSRSHSILLLEVCQRSLRDLSTRTGRLNLCDLAGSEKVLKTGAEGARLDEAKMINKSLSALGNVINALTDSKAKHVPYRDSKLTRVLQESLGGNARTTLIINCSPSAYNAEETLSTLRFGNRAKNIRNRDRCNVERSAAELKAMLARAEKEIERLNEVISSLQEENTLLKDNFRPESQESKPLSEESFPTEFQESKPLSEVHSLQELMPMLPSVSALNARIEELESNLLVAEDEKLQSTEAQDTLADMLLENEDKLKVVQNEVSQAKERCSKLETMIQENNLISDRLNQAILEREHVEHSAEETAILLESMVAQNEDLMKELEVLQQRVITLEEELKENLSEVSSNSLLDVQKKTGDPLITTSPMIDRVVQLKEGHKIRRPRSLSFGAQLQAEKVAWLLREEQLADKLQSGMARIDEIADILQKNKESSDSSFMSSGGGCLKEPGSKNEVSSTSVDIVEAKPITQETNSDDLGEVQQLRVGAGKDNTEGFGDGNLDSSQNSSWEFSIDKPDRVHELTLELEQLRCDMRRRLEEFDILRSSLQRDLENRVGKVVELEMQLDEMVERYEFAVKSTQAKKDRQMRRKLTALERSSSQSHRNIEKLGSENRRLNIEATAASRQLVLRRERIMVLERDLQQQERENAKLREQLKYSQSISLSGSVGKDLGTGISGTLLFPPSATGNIVRPVRGGSITSEGSSLRSPPQKKGFFASLMSSVRGAPRTPPPPEELDEIRTVDCNEEENSGSSVSSPSPQWV